MTQFKDHFSARAAIYSQFRPQYPQPLFDWLGSLVERHRLAWDCGTGNGQAATSLAAYFDNVVATDASEKQIAQAAQHPGVEYRVATAYESGLAVRSVDLVTVAQAIHWFDRDAFYQEAKRVMHARGALAIWGYGDPMMESDELGAIVHQYNRGTIEEFWRPERQILLDGLRTIDFPFREVEAPEMTLECHWTLAELTGYLRTWSATAAYADHIGTDPVEPVEAALAAHWGSPDERRRIQWPLHTRAGYA